MQDTVSAENFQTDTRPEPRCRLARTGIFSVFWAGFVAATMSSLQAYSQEYDFRTECIIRASQEVRLASAVSGLLASVNVDRGDTVEVGQVVAELESETQAVQLELAKLRSGNTLAIESAQARLAASEERAQRAEQLFERNVIPQERFDELMAERRLAVLEVEQARHEQASAQLEARLARITLELHQIKSPIDGVVVERMLSSGEFVHHEAHVMRLVQLDPLHVDVFLPAMMLPRVAVGDEVSVFPQEPVGGGFAAVVTVVDRVLDAASGTFGVQLEMANPDSLLPGGLRCDVAFEGANGDEAAGTANDASTGMQ